MMFILSIASAAIFYSAWYMNLPVFSLGWFFYCLAWVPLLMAFVSANKYDHENESTHDIPIPMGSRKIT